MYFCSVNLIVGYSVTSPVIYTLSGAHWQHVSTLSPATELTESISYEEFSSIQFKMVSMRSGKPIPPQLNTLRVTHATPVYVQEVQVGLQSIGSEDCVLSAVFNYYPHHVGNHAHSVLGGYHYYSFPFLRFSIGGAAYATVFNSSANWAATIYIIIILLL